jgi:hypothetical protein
MNTIKRPKLVSLDGYECNDHCDRLEYPCIHSRWRSSAYDHNEAVKEAMALYAIEQIEETKGGAWLVCDKWYFHTSSKLARPKGKRCKSQKFESFTAFWKYINDKEKASEWNIKRQFRLTEEDRPIDRRKLLSDNDPMPVGKYKGRELKYVPDNYLMFLWKMFRLSEFDGFRGNAGYVAEYIERRIKNKQLILNPET